MFATASQTKHIRLSDLAVGKQARIVEFDAPEVEVALIRMGVIPGNLCRLSHIAPLGDPIAFDVNGTKVAMRKKDARHVWVTVE
jgi:Fe2+ transport system protein FeoA